jgi:ribosomal protein L44E
VIDQWYYWHELEILGPFSGKQLVDLAASGDILPDDIVWKDGVEGGIAANKVQHLFAAPPAVPLALVTTEASGTAPVAVSAEVAKVADATAAPVAAPVEEPAKPTWDRGRASTGGKARAVAGKGAIIVGQDGKTVKFRMKCTVCNHEDSSWQSMLIARGTTRKMFYCPKCRKKCSVEVNGYVS